MAITAEEKQDVIERNLKAYWSNGEKGQDPRDDVMLLCSATKWFVVDTTMGPRVFVAEDDTAQAKNLKQLIVMSLSGHSESDLWKSAKIIT